MKTNTRRMVTSALLLGAAGLVCIPAQAGLYGPDTELRTRSVPVADLDLSSDAGVSTLYRRLKRAAREVCGPQNLRQAGSVLQLRFNKECFETALEQTIAEIGNEGLAALHAT